MNQYEFDLLLRRYMEGACTDQEEKQIVEWSEQMLNSTQIEMTNTEKSLVKKRIWRRLVKLTHKQSIFQWPWIGLAASIALLLTIGFGYWYTTDRAVGNLSANQDHTTLPFGNIEVKNTSNKPYKLTLDDGTQITLKPQSSISYPEHFEDQERIVHLQGEAFFDVTKDASRPFFVYTGELVTRVLGTSFNIKAHQNDKAVEVSVVTGRVSVYESSKKTPQTRNGIILNPNQKIRFEKDVKFLVPELVEEPVVVHPPEQKSLFVFDETPLPKVAEMLQHVYGIEIVLESAQLQDCVFTGDINDLPLYSQLKLICKSIHANYELQGTTLFISGEGCRH